MVIEITGARGGIVTTGITTPPPPPEKVVPVVIEFIVFAVAAAAAPPPKPSPEPEDPPIIALLEIGGRAGTPREVVIGMGIGGNGTDIGGIPPAFWYGIWWGGIIGGGIIPNPGPAMGNGGG